MADPKQTASWHKMRQKLTTSVGMTVMTTRKGRGIRKMDSRGESKQKKDCSRKSSHKQNNANKTELDGSHRPL
eukprot:12241980-Ditylum_brightwellii.AAC.1